MSASTGPTSAAHSTRCGKNWRRWRRSCQSGQDGHEALADEIGDLLFAVVNLARKAGVQPGPALDRTNAKFRRRFAEIERIAGEKEIDMHTAGLEVLDGLWDEVKQREKPNSVNGER